KFFDPNGQFGGIENGNAAAKANLNVTSIWIDDPAEVAQALAALRLKDTNESRMGLYYGRRPPPNPNPHMEIEFKFNDKQSRTHSFEGGTMLGPYVVNSEFRDKIRGIVQKHVGHDI